MKHFSEADLLETYYMRPGESLPIMMHLADCADCAGRYERLERKMRSLSECAHHDEKPETFWARQRLAVMRKIDARRSRTASVARVMRIAAAAMLVLVLGALVTWDRPEPPAAAVAAPAAQPAAVQAAPADESSPWQSDELNEYSSMVAWESWVENGDQS